MNREQGDKLKAVQMITDLLGLIAYLINLANWYKQQARFEHIQAETRLRHYEIMKRHLTETIEIREGTIERLERDLALLREQNQHLQNQTPAADYYMIRDSQGNVWGPFAVN